MLHRYRALFLALSVLILLLMAYTAFWATAAARMRSLLADAPGRVLTEKGIALDLKDAVVEGFPLRLTARLSAVRAQWPSGTVLTMGAMELTAWAWSPLEIELASEGPLRLDLAGSARHAPISGMAAGLGGTLVLGTDGKAKEAAITLDQPRTEATESLGPLAARELTLSWLAPAKPPAGPTDSQGMTSLRFSDIDLPGAVLPPLKPRIEQLALSLEPRGPMPAKPSVETMTAWRDGGGTLELLALRLAWSGLDLRANATLALDSQMQPEGAGTAQLSGGELLIDMLAQSGAMKPDQATGVKAALALLSKAGDDGRRSVSVPVTLQNQILSIGPMKVAVLPVIPWN